MQFILVFTIALVGLIVSIKCKQYIEIEEHRNQIKKIKEYYSKENENEKR